MSIIKILQEQYLSELKYDAAMTDDKIDSNESSKIKKGIGAIKGTIDKNNLDEKMDKVKHGFKDAQKNLDPSFFQTLKLGYEMVQAYIDGSYTKVPWETILTLVAVLIYVVSPVDVIPDVIPVAGWLDDGWVITRLIPAIEKDIKKYQAWTDEPNDEMDEL